MCRCWLHGFPAAVRFYIRAGQFLSESSIEISSSRSVSVRFFVFGASGIGELVFGGPVSGYFYVCAHARWFARDTSMSIVDHVINVDNYLCLLLN